jgi:hypothetical protein
MRRFKRNGVMYGLMMLSMGVGMLMVIVVPRFAIVLALALVAAGMWLALFKGC